MERNNFESYLKDSFETFNGNVDNDKVWDNIEPHLKKKKKRRFIFWLWGIGILSLGIFTLVSYNKDYDNYSHLEKNEPQNTFIKKSNENTPKVENIKATDQKKSLSSQLTNKKILVSQELQSNDIVPTKSISELDISIHDFNGLLKESRVSNTQNNRVTTLSFLPQISSALQIPLRDIIQVKQLKRKKSRSEKLKRKKSKKIFPFKIKNISLEGFFTLSPLYQHNIVSANIPVLESMAYEAEVKSLHKPLEAFSFTAGIQALHKNKLMFTLGIEYQHINSKFSDSETITTTEIDNNAIISQTENMFGEIIKTSYGSKEVTTTTTRKFEYYRTLHSLNIPIGIGTYWSSKNNTFKLLGGLSYNLTTQYRGAFLNRGLTIRTLENSRSNLYKATFKKNTGIGMWTSFIINRQMNEQLSFVVAPRVHLPIGNIYREEFLINRRSINLAVDLGLNYRFAKKKKKRRRTL